MKTSRADLAAIHVAKKALGWDDDTYRDVMAQVCGARSAGDLDGPGRRRFLAHLQACLRRAGAAPAGRSTARRPWSPRHLRLWAEWQKLADMGRVNQRDRAGLNGWVKAQAGVDDVSWATDEQLDMLIERAKAWRTREV